MSKEIYHRYHPRHSHVRWGIFYLLLTVAIAAAGITWSHSLRTYTLPSGSIELEIPYSTYLVGEPITFQIKNNYNSKIYIPNHCPSEPLAVYRLESDKWKRIHAKTSLKKCPNTERSIEIEAGQIESGNYTNWASLFQKPGTYRIAAMVDYFNSVSYEDFKVIAKPKPGVVAKTPTTQQTIQPSSSPTTNSSPTTPTTTPTTTIPSLPKKTISVSGGSVVVEYSSSRVYVLSISPSSGCTYEGGQSGTTVEITFKCGGEDETQLQLWVSNGQLIQRVEQDD